MSHFASVKTEIKNLDHLEQALNELGIPYEKQLEGQGLELRTKWTDMNKPTFAHLVIRYENIGKDGYKCRADVGFKRNAEGSYEIVADSYELRQGHNEGFIQQISGKYVEKTVEALGYRLERVETGHGKYTMTVMPGRTVANRR